MARSFGCLISQVEHARVSGELVRHWHEQFSHDVVEAIAHHDDGWAAWEAEPKLNPEIGAPYSFLEMPLAESLVIWDHSIAAARQVWAAGGLYRGGTFLQFAHRFGACQGSARDCLADGEAKASARRGSTNGSAAIRRTRSSMPKRAQQMLLTLPICSACGCAAIVRSDGDDASILGQSAMKLRTDTLLSQFQFRSPEFAIREVGRRRIASEGLRGSSPVDPYPFKCVALIAVGSWRRRCRSSRYANLAGIEGRELAGGASVAAGGQPSQNGDRRLKDLVDLAEPR